jgi:hypothetical protein
MKGIRIYEAVVDSLPDGVSAFVIFFKPILPRFEKVHWLYESLPFSYSRDTTGELEKAVQVMPNYNGYIPPNTLLPKYSHCISNDWSSIFGFDSRPDAAVIFANLEPRDCRFMEDTIDLCFFSVDGAYWDFYSKNEDLLRVVTEHASSLAGVQVEQVKFSDFEF